MNKKLIAPIVTAGAMLATSIGSTFALFSSKASSRIDIEAGKVQVNYSSTLDYAQSRYLDTDVFDAIEAAEGTDYDALFENGGTAVIEEGDSTVLKLDKFAPMDTISLTTKAFNESNINIKYRYFVKLDGELIPALQIKIDGTDYSTDLEHYEIKSVWSSVITPNVEGLFQKDVKISFPYGSEEQNFYQNKGCTIEIGIEAIQGNATVHDEQTNPEIPSFETIYSAKPSSDDKAADMQNSNGTVRTEVQGSSVKSDAERLTFNVEKLDECHDDTPVDDSNNYVALDLEIEEIKDDNADPIKMSVDIGQNKEEVKVYHQGEQIADAVYNTETGIVSWETLSCSQFDITWKIALVTNYEELTEALAAEKEYIRFGNDIVDIPNTNSVVINCSTEIDGRGHVLSHVDGESSGNHAVISVGADDLDIKLENLGILNSKSYGIYNGYSDVNLSLYNCSVVSWFNIMFANLHKGNYESSNCTLEIDECSFTLNQTYAGTTNGALCLQINGYNQKVSVKNSSFMITTTSSSAEAAVIGGSNYKWSTGGSNMGDCEFTLENCTCDFNGASNWFYYFDCDEENDTNSVVATNCAFSKADEGDSIFTNPYSFNYPVKFDYCLFSMDVSEITETEGTHPTPLHFTQNSDGSWSN